MIQQIYLKKRKLTYWQVDDKKKKKQNCWLAWRAMRFGIFTFRFSPALLVKEVNQYPPYSMVLKEKKSGSENKKGTMNNWYSTLVLCFD